jgi:hypothetical protein
MIDPAVIQSLLEQVRRRQEAAPTGAEWAQPDATVRYVIAALEDILASAQDRADLAAIKAAFDPDADEETIKRAERALKNQSKKTTQERKRLAEIERQRQRGEISPREAFDAIAKLLKPPS